jgi:hypothetical protein
VIVCTDISARVGTSCYKSARRLRRIESVWCRCQVVRSSQASFLNRALVRSQLHTVTCFMSAHMDNHNLLLLGVEEVRRMARRTKTTNNDQIVWGQCVSDTHSRLRVLWKSCDQPRADVQRRVNHVTFRKHETPCFSCLRPHPPTRKTMGDSV